MLFYILSIFASAFLIFQVQPMIARVILPWFGGTPAVWSTVMLFFQVLLTGGYAYSYWLAGKVQAQRQGKIHLVFLSISVLLLLGLGVLWPSPITPDSSWKPTGVNWPILRIFILLAATVGLPYFMLATNSPLMQAWFSRSFPQKSPYWLYALSNVGSLLALVSYPFLIEPLLSLRQQGWAWSLGYLLFVGLAGYGAWRSAWQKTEGLEYAGDLPHPAQGPTPAAFIQILWIALSMVASVLLLAVTSQMTQEVAVIPFLWVLPLAVYLLSFVFAFSGEGRYYRPAFALAFLGVSAGLAYLILYPATHFLWQIVIYTVFLFVACMIAHGELYRLRPAPAHLTRFYLMVSLGGALGGVFVNLIAPAIFDGYWELYLGWAALWLALAVLTFVRRTLELRPRWRFGHDALIGAVAVTVLVFSGYTILSMASGDLLRERNFYGILRVLEGAGTRTMVHGATSHGVQFLDEARRDLPTSYYWQGSGVGLALRSHPRYGQQPMKVGVLGLGIGVLAAYGQPGDTYRFYEINPLVVDLAEGRNGYFSFLSDSQAAVEVVLGDARISLEQELLAGQRQNYDVLVLDTFSSDAIPVHLITREAFTLYLEQLAPDGVIAAHISNRHLDLQPVTWQMAQEFELSLATVFVSEEPAQPESFPSLWMILARDPAFLEAPAFVGKIDRMTGFKTNIRLWTDDYSNLFQVLR